jgi:hypothetical protein
MEATDEAGRPFDRTITCVDCRTLFVWTVGEQAFFRERNFTAPRRCRPCRDRVRERKLSALNEL